MFVFQKKNGLSSLKLNLPEISSGELQLVKTVRHIRVLLKKLYQRKVRSRESTDEENNWNQQFKSLKGSGNTFSFAINLH